GFRCTDCGFQAHRRCADRVPPHCLPDMKYVKRVFGSDLTTLVKATPPTAVPGVPAVLERCVDEIESRGLDSEGLYRVAGFHDDIEVIKLAFDKETLDNPVDLSRFDDVNTVASVLKAYLRSLPIPVITYDMYDKFLAVVRREGDDSTAQLNASLRQCVSELPPAHRQTLNYLCRHLHRVAARQRINMMSPENLAIVLAPTLLRSPSAEYIADPLRVLNNAKYERLVVEMLISEYETGFRCTDCGFQAHRRCADRVPPHCLPDMKYVKRVFGSDLTTLVKATPPTAVPGVPAVLERCTRSKSRGLDSEGLYRVAGFHDDIEVIKLAFDKETLDNPVDLSRFDDVNTVASVLKAYLRSLPIPVITYDMYDKFLAVVRDDSTAQLNASLRQCVSELPPAHRQTLNYLCRHLHRVAARQRINMMSPENLAIVLAPTLLRSPSAEYIADPLRVLNNAKYERLVVEMLISEYETVFA
uniref:Rho-GAP domain-containing protein n=1 Tax=Macrostomum lignano TaxID=282301 RepID=A0A1I8IBP5_9PLAT